jgi:hypothetical protein
LVVYFIVAGASALIEWTTFFLLYAWVTRGAGSGQHLASVLPERRENANIDAGLGFIWRISV